MISPDKIKYTLCFIEHENSFLMLYRSKEPNANQWNGVGGKLNQGEMPHAAIKREIDEETGIIPINLKLLGVVSWNDEGGMYVYHAETPMSTFHACDEGILAWKSKDWVLHSPEVVTNIPIFLPKMLSGSDQLWYFSFYYNNQGLIVDYKETLLNEKDAAYLLRK